MTWRFWLGGEYVLADGETLWDALKTLPKAKRELVTKAERAGK